MARRTVWEQPALDDLFQAGFEYASTQQVDERTAAVDVNAAPPRGSRPAPPAAPAQGAVDSTVDPVSFRPTGQSDLAPIGAGARIEANMEALRLLAELRDQDRTATPDEQVILARYGAWGGQGVWQALDERRPGMAEAATAARAVLGEEGWEAARAGTTTQFFTDAALVQAMWAAVQRLGFAGGRVLEPGCGTGTFIGFAPPGAVMVGVEVDPTAADIAAALYPGSTIRRESFADTNLPDGLFDVAIGNVPYAQTKLLDPLHNPGRAWSIHNHFVAKSLDLVRPGGLVAVLTSTATMDAADPSARRHLADLGDLVAAVRLPNGVFSGSAGTEVACDLLVLRRRRDGEAARDLSWVETAIESLPGGSDGFAQMRLNRWWMEHPDAVAGTMSVAPGRFGPELRVTGDGTGPVPAGIADLVVAQAVRAGLSYTPADASVDVPEMADRAMYEGQLLDRDGGFWQVTAGVLAPLKVPATQATETRALLGLRDGARNLLELESDRDADPVLLEATRGRLRAAWEAYTAAYGPLLRTILYGKGDDEERVAPPAMRRLLKDPFGPLVTALERYETDWEAAKPAGLLLKRQIEPHRSVDHVDNASDGLAVSLDRTGRVDVDLIRSLMPDGTTREQVIDGLAGQIWEDPAGGGWLLAADYLSGDVRGKLDAAREAAAADPRWQGNVDALLRVQPRDLGMGDITARLGAVWIPESDVGAFTASILGVDPDQVSASRDLDGKWKIGAGYVRYRAEAVSEWGTQRRPATALIEAICQGAEIKVTDKESYIGSDGREHTHDVVNVEETVQANAKADQLRARFAEWVWEDPERAARLVADYNRRFNSTVLRNWDEQGQGLTFPGLALGFTPHPHQRSAVARIIAEPSVGLFHQVGAGKTAEMVMGCMELRRLGLARKPMVVVPHQLLLQWASEWARLYPRARILVADSGDTSPEKRSMFLARAAGGEWDAIILTQTAFTSIRVDPRFEADWIGEQLDALEARLEAARGDDDTPRHTLKEIAGAKSRLEERLKAVTDQGRKDVGIGFEQLGVDLLVVDEIHLFKNIGISSTYEGMARNGSARANDLAMKLDSLRRSNPDGHALIGATGTPVTNSIAEMWVLSRLFDPAGLRRAGMSEFDEWASVFAEAVTRPETTGSGQFRMKTRLARFVNLPEMLSLMQAFGDVKTQEDLHLPVPALTVDPATGIPGRRLLAISPDEETAALMAALAAREDRIHAGGVNPKDDNMLSVLGQGRLASLDTRLVDPGARGGLKTGAAADLLASMWEAHRGDVYLDEDGAEAAVKGSLQIVFCDLGTPKDEFNAYDDLRTQLVERGLPAGAIRFAQDARTSEAKDRLYQDCRAGRVAVLVGSTNAMGTGVNVQKRAVHLLHLDAPWRPDELEQREGRILRQGNDNPAVTITQMVVTRTTDTLMWQTLERKARFIGQVMHNRLDTRVAEDIEDDDTAVRYGAIKAAASGDPDILLQADAQTDLTRLVALERAYRNNLQSLRWTIDADNRQLIRSRESLAQLRAAAPRSIPTAGEGFTAVIAHPDQAYQTGSRRDAAPAPAQVGALNAQTDRLTSRADAAASLSRVLGRWARTGGGPLAVARLGGHTVNAALEAGAPGSVNLKMWLTDAPSIQRVAPASMAGGHIAWNGAGLITRMENMIAAIPDEITRVTTLIADLGHRVEVNTRLLDEPFRQAGELQAARTLLEDVNARIEDRTHQNQLPSTADIGTQTSPPATNRAAGGVPESAAGIEVVTSSHTGRAATAMSATREPGDDQPAPPVEDAAALADWRDRLPGWVAAIDAAFTPPGMQDDTGVTMALATIREALNAGHATDLERALADAGMPGAVEFVDDAIVAQHDAIVAQVLSESGTRVSPIDGYGLLIGATPSGQGVFVVWNREAGNCLTEAVYEQIVAEAETAGLPAGAYTVWSDFNFYTTAGVTWVQADPGEWGLPDRNAGAQPRPLTAQWHAMRDAARNVIDAAEADQSFGGAPPVDLAAARSVLEGYHRTGRIDALRETINDLGGLTGGAQHWLDEAIRQLDAPPESSAATRPPADLPGTGAPAAAPTEDVTPSEPATADTIGDLTEALRPAMQGLPAYQKLDAVVELLAGLPHLPDGWQSDPGTLASVDRYLREALGTRQEDHVRRILDVLATHPAATARVANHDGSARPSGVDESRFTIRRAELTPTRGGVVVVETAVDGGPLAPADATAPAAQERLLAELRTAMGSAVITPEELLTGLPPLANGWAGRPDAPDRIGVAVRKMMGRGLMAGAVVDTLLAYGDTTAQATRQRSDDTLLPSAPATPVSPGPRSAAGSLSDVGDLVAYLRPDIADRRRAEVTPGAYRIVQAAMERREMAGLKELVSGVGLHGAGAEIDRMARECRTGRPTPEVPRRIRGGGTIIADHSSGSMWVVDEAGRAERDGRPLTAAALLGVLQDEHVSPRVEEALAGVYPQVCRAEWAGRIAAAAKLPEPCAATVADARSALDEARAAGMLGDVETALTKSGRSWAADWARDAPPGPAEPCAAVTPSLQPLLDFG